MLKITVGIDGDYHTIDEALQAVPYNEEALICVSEGLYREKLFFEKKNITIEGTGENKTVISWGDGAKDIMPDGTKRGTFRSYTLFAGGESVRIKNLTVENNAGSGKKAGQALAVYADAQNVYMENVCLKGHQDTLFMSPLPESVRQPGGFFGPRHLTERRLTRQYYKNCKITGDVDFIFGGADAVFDSCEIVVNDREKEENREADNAVDITPKKGFINGYITAPCENPGKLGIVFKDCVIRGEEGIAEGSVFLGRPWRPTGKTVYINCEFDESIHLRRFSEWGSIEAEGSEAFFAEYNSRSLDGSALDLKDRNPWIRLLTDDEAEDFIQKINESFQQ